MPLPLDSGFPSVRFATRVQFPRPLSRPSDPNTCGGLPLGPGHPVPRSDGFTGHDIPIDPWSSHGLTHVDLAWEFPSKTAWDSQRSSVRTEYR